MLQDIRDWRAGRLDWEEVMRGLLLSGPTGSGKTEIARLLAREAGFDVRATSVAEWLGSGTRGGDTIRQMRQFFADAQANVPCIVFIDELDAIGNRARPHDHNSSWTDTIVTALLECLDGFGARTGIVLLAATNHVDKIDTAIRRPGRFDKLLHLDYPDLEQMPAVFRWHLKSDLPDADLSALIPQSVGMSGAQVGGVVREARARARRAKRALSLADLHACLETGRPPQPPALRERVAVHEAGHVIAAMATGAAQPYCAAITLWGGFVRQTRRVHANCRADIEAEIIALLAGRAAERLVFDDVSGGAGGDEDSDLARATKLAAAFELSFGLSLSLRGPVWLGTPDEAIAQMRTNPALQERVALHLQRLEAVARSILEQNRHILDDLAIDLLTCHVLHGAALEVHLNRIDPTSQALLERHAPSAA
jgi:ATP-dependent Zn protease